MSCLCACLSFPSKHSAVLMSLICSCACTACLMSCPPLKALILAVCTATVHVSCLVHPYCNCMHSYSACLLPFVHNLLISPLTWSNLLRPHSFSEASCVFTGAGASGLAEREYTKHHSGTGTGSGSGSGFGSDQGYGSSGNTGSHVRNPIPGSQELT